VPFRLEVRLSGLPKPTRVVAGAPLQGWVSLRFDTMRLIGLFAEAFAPLGLKTV
jgi:hypothetical protein